MCAHETSGSSKSAIRRMPGRVGGCVAMWGAGGGQRIQDSNLFGMSFRIESQAGAGASVVAARLSPHTCSASRLGQAHEFPMDHAPLFSTPPSGLQVLETCSARNGHDSRGARSRWPRLPPQVGTPSFHSLPLPPRFPPLPAAPSAPPPLPLQPLAHRSSPTPPAHPAAGGLRSGGCCRRVRRPGADPAARGALEPQVARAPRRRRVRVLAAARLHLRPRRGCHGGIVAGARVLLHQRPDVDRVAAEVVFGGVRGVSSWTRPLAGAEVEQGLRHTSPSNSDGGPRWGRCLASSVGSCLAEASSPERGALNRPLKVRRRGCRQRTFPREGSGVGRADLDHPDSLCYRWISSKRGCAMQIPGFLMQARMPTGCRTAQQLLTVVDIRTSIERARLSLESAFHSHTLPDPSERCERQGVEDTPSQMSRKGHLDDLQARSILCPLRTRWFVRSLLPW